MLKDINEYKKIKKEYGKAMNITSDNVYTYFTDRQIQLIQRYYSLYTKFLFNKIMGSLRLKVSKKKTTQLIHLRGDDVWEFDGLVDVQEKGNASCELGHPLRYVYSAVNKTTGKRLKFGSTCVSDFFDLDEEGVKALINVKNEMFVELKNLAIISSNSLWKEHFTFDCFELGKVYQLLGVDGVKKMGTGSIFPIVCDFLTAGLPLPKSMLSEVLKVQEEIRQKICNMSFWGVDSESLQVLKSTSISAIQNMFVLSEAKLRSGLLEQEVTQPVVVSNKIIDFFNFRSVSSLADALPIWRDRNDRLLQAHDYFRSKGVTSPWFSLRDVAEHLEAYKEEQKLNRVIDILCLFDINVYISTAYRKNYYEYSCRSVSLDETSCVCFDDLITSMASASILQKLLALQGEYDRITDAKNQENQKDIEMMEYLKTNLTNSKYTGVFGIDGVKNMIITSSLVLERMTPKQKKYVTGVYTCMKNLDEAVAVRKDAEDVNNRYMLKDCPEVLGKIQRLQTEGADRLTEKTKGIITSILTYKQVSDKQKRHINDAYATIILNEQSDLLSPEKISYAAENENKKWALIERLDVKEKILAIQQSSEYASFVSDTVKDILTRVLRYNTVSDKQIGVIDRTYKRVCR